MRRVKVYNNYRKETLEYEGIFHQWGSDIIDTSDNIVSFSVAIVELDNGDVRAAAADCIQFLDKNCQYENPFCEHCREKPNCVISMDGTCAMIRKYLNIIENSHISGGTLSAELDRSTIGGAS